MKKILLLTLTTFYTLAPTASMAQVTDEGIACIQYQRQDYSFGDTYAVPYIVVDGDSLNDATSSYNYQSYSNYAVVTWPNGGYSAINIQSYRDELPIYQITAPDQSGRNYQIKKSHSNYCY